MTQGCDRFKVGWSVAPAASARLGDVRSSAVHILSHEHTDTQTESSKRFCDFYVPPDLAGAPFRTTPACGQPATYRSGSTAFRATFSVGSDHITAAAAAAVRSILEGRHHGEAVKSVLFGFWHTPRAGLQRVAEVGGSHRFKMVELFRGQLFGVTPQNRPATLPAFCVFTFVSFMGTVLGPNVVARTGIYKPLHPLSGVESLALICGRFNKGQAG